MQFIVVMYPKDKFRREGPPADFALVELAEEVQAKALYKSGGIRQLWGLKKEGKGQSACLRRHRRKSWR